MTIHQREYFYGQTRLAEGPFKARFLNKEVQ